MPAAAVLSIDLFMIVVLFSRNSHVVVTERQYPKGLCGLEAESQVILLQSAKVYQQFTLFSWERS